jgi:hypothetical protein
MSDEHLAVESRVGADPRRRPSVLRGLRDLEPDLQRIPGNLWTLFVCGSYLAIVTWSLARHVLWRDEAQLWLVARASGSLPELLTNMTYENRPILWFLLLWPIARLTSNPEVVKALPWVASAAFAVIVTRFLPLARIEQVAVLSGFLFLLGYSTFSAGYMLGAVLTLAWFMAFARGSIVGQFAFAALMAATHALFLILAMPLWLLTAIAWLRGTQGRRRQWPRVGAAAVSAIVIAFSVWLVIPPADYSFWTRSPVAWVDVPWKLVEYAGSAVRPPTFGVVPDTGLILVLLSALPVMVIAVVAVACGRAVLLFPVVGLALLVANGVFGFGPYWWHTGAVVVALMLIVLMTRHVVGASWFAPPMLWQSLAWWAVLVLQVLGTAVLPGGDLWGDQPYSGSKAAAEVVSRYCPSGCPVVTDDDIVSVGVSAYLGGQPLFHVNTNRWATFALWDQVLASQRKPTWDEIGRALEEEGSGAVGVVSTLRDPPAGFEVLAEPGGAVQTYEEFLVVRLKGQPVGTPPAAG